MARERRKLDALHEAEREILQKVKHEQEQEWEEVRALLNSRKMGLELEIQERNRRLDRRESALQKVENELDLRWEQWEEQQKKMKSEESQLNHLIRSYKRKLEELSETSREQILEEFREQVRNEHKEDLLQYRKELFGKDRKVLEEEGQRILIDVIQRLKGKLPVLSIYTVVPLPSDGYKGMVIGRDGRNCKAFEMATGVTVLIDEGVNSVTLSGFDPVKREVARIALENLIQEGRVTPGLIEEAVGQAQEQMQKNILEAGENALKFLGIGPVSSEILRALGKLGYRMSRGQNTLEHSIEVAQICGMLAGELGLDTELAKRAGLFHDIGKASEGNRSVSHANAGARMLEVYGEKAEVVNAVEAHHQEVEERSLYAPLVQIADALSASRDGARVSSMGDLIERVGNLENLAKTVEGVREAHAFQAGRELRVIVSSEQIEDWEVRKIARQIRNEIEQKLEFFEPIRITVIREVRFSETAH